MLERKEPRKIALVGTSAIGKTTILEHFREQFSQDPTVAFVDEAARQFFLPHPEVTDRFGVDAQGQVQALALTNEEEARRLGARIILCDRSVLDAVAYVRSQGDLQGSEQLYARVAAHLPTYHAIVLLDPVGVPFSTDEVRREGEDMREIFHKAFIHLFTEKGIKFELLSGTLQERIARVLEIINE